MRKKGTSRRRRPGTLLSHGRPPIFNKKASLSSKAARSVIHNYHQLQKRRTKALADKDLATAEALASKIEDQGGIDLYQQASLKGQSSERGGDTSKILKTWLQPILESEALKQVKLRMLEIGALSKSNAFSSLDLFKITRIDLNAQERGIQKQDFMERPLPKDETERFDIISLSLVLNYVSDPFARGEMLLRIRQFLRSPPQGVATKGFCPSLFVVLPAPCVMNSRYLDEDRLLLFMSSLGYTLVKQKRSAKLVYSLWRYAAEDFREDWPIPKIELRIGKKCNNFAIARR